MKGIKLSPLNLFIILVLVLIFSLVIGYSVRESFKEGMETTTTATMKSYAPYSNAQLLIIKPSDDSSGAIYFDPVYGNIVNVLDDSDSTSTSMSPGGASNSNGQYVIVTRSGNSVDKVDLANAKKIDMLQGTKESWSYNFAGSTIIYVTWDTKTVIYLLDNVSGEMKSIYISTYVSDSKQTNLVDNSLHGSKLPSGTSTVVPSMHQESTVNGVEAWQISENVYFNFQKGIYIKTNSGYNNAHDSQAVSGSILAYDYTNNRAVVSTKIALNQSPAAIVLIIVNQGTSDASASNNYQVNTTARVNYDNTSGNTSKGNGHSNNSSGGNGTSGDSCAPKKKSCDDDSDDENPYILKTQVVPPVCPMCPTQCDTPPADNTSSGCSVTVNDQGQLIDCSGNVIKPPSSISPDYYFGQGLAETAQSAIQTTGSTIDTGITSATDLAGKTLDTAGGALDTGLSTAGKAVSDVTSGAEGAITGVTKDITGMISGLGRDVTGIATQGIQQTGGLASQTVGSATGLASQTIDTGANLLYSTGQGVYDIAQQGIYRDPYGVYRNAYGQPVEAPMMQQSTYPGAPVYPTGRYQGYGTCSMPYPMPQSGYDPMPVTNDFSQFT